MNRSSEYAVYKENDLKIDSRTIIFENLVFF